ncbi:hypothetical protein MTR_7g051967 [Medicago truncatula]|uniref:Uncharacterized protein n=1 Tax=Medicago truncatula TaxID=3880 RepID=A0A072TYE6_MEDTR|nr:hypothetical protein MTR_7g051967 [Medicago truncatula]
MNRVIKKTVSNVFALKIPRKCFCSQVVKVDASTNILPSNGHEKKPIISQIIPEYDVAIVGGGMVGMALACFLGANTYRFGSQSKGDCVVFSSTWLHGCTFGLIQLDNSLQGLGVTAILDVVPLECDEPNIFPKTYFLLQSMVVSVVKVSGYSNTKAQQNLNNPLLFCDK